MRYSTWWCVQAGPHDLASRVASFQGQSPLYYFVAWASTAMLGASEVALRVPSVVSSSVTAVLCGAAAYVLAGRRAGLWAGSLVWLTFAQVQSGVNARPYALAILGTGAMTLGYVATVRTGSAWSRVLFIGGSALQFWAHFLLVLPLLGLAAAHLLLPARRGCYTVRAFAVDCLCVLGVCAPAWPYVLAASTRMQHVTWLAAPKHADIVALLAPFALPLLMSVGMRRTANDSSPALVASAAGVIVALEAALFLHANLVTARYLEPIVVPLAILAGVALSRLPARDIALSVAAFLAINGANTGRAFRATGTFSGLGVEDWRGASEIVREAVRSRGATVILLRSGFIEESMPVPGAAPPATRAVLAGPGETPLQSERHLADLSVVPARAGRVLRLRGRTARRLRACLRRRGAARVGRRWRLRRAGRRMGARQVRHDVRAAPDEDRSWRGCLRLQSFGVGRDFGGGTRTSVRA